VRDFEIVERNLRVAMRFFGEATGRGEVRSLTGVDAMYSGLDYGVFNIAVLSEAVRAGGGGLETRIAECGRYYGGRATRWSFWLCEDLLESAVRRRARTAFGECGLRVISQPPGMMSEELRAPERELPPVECVAVNDQAARDTFAGITSTCFDIPIKVSDAVYKPERAWAGAYRGYVGLVDGRPVGIAATVEAAGVLGIYSLATLPDFRRHGIGEALLRAVVARARVGKQALVLQSTEAGYRMYRRTGFRDVAKFAVYLTK